MRRKVVSAWLTNGSLGADQMVKAPENERTIAAFNDMCPAVNA